MIQAMYSGISGMKAFKSSLDVIGNNIANINTTAYKAGRATFKEMLSQTVSGATAPSADRGGTNATQIGLGVVLGSIDINGSQGSMQATGRGTDLAIEGNGFFALGSSNGMSYTRDGSFSLDAQFNLVSSSSGMKVLGWAADTTTGEVDTTRPVTNSSSIQVPVGGMSTARATSQISLAGNLDASSAGPKATSTIALAGNLDSAAAAGTAVDVGPFDIYDSLGTAHSVTVTFTKQAAADTWRYSVACADATAGSLPAPTDFTFTGAGASNLASIPLSLTWTTPNGSTQPLVASIDTSTLTQTAAGSTAAMSSQNGTPPGDPVPVKFDIYDSLGLTHEMTITFSKTSDPATWDYSVACPDATTGSLPADGQITFNSLGQSQLASIPLSLTWSDPNGSEQPLVATIETDGISQLNGAKTVDLSYQDGLQLGTLESFSIGRDGMITGTFTNGSSRSLGQMALAQFNNPAGLSKVGNNTLAESPNSGTAKLGLPGSGGIGMITAGFLESSNVDLANEFANMIVAQRGFQASSRIITTSDDVLQELVSLKR